MDILTFTKRTSITLIGMSSEPFSCPYALFGKKLYVSAESTIIDVRIKTESDPILFIEIHIFLIRTLNTWIKNVYLQLLLLMY